jgi:hypothetical protein
MGTINLPKCDHDVNISMTSDDVSHFSIQVSAEREKSREPGRSRPEKSEVLDENLIMTYPPLPTI